MLILISPAKTLDYQSPLATTRFTLPELLDHSQQLIHEARKLSAPQIKKLMNISDKLADPNATRFHDCSQISHRKMPVRLFWHLKATSIPVCKPRRSVKKISILPNSIYACFLVYTAYCAHWI